MKARSLIISSAALALLATSTPAQDLNHDVGAWFAAAGQGSIESGGEKTRWRWWFDAHARFLDGSEGVDQSIVRPGFGYDLSKRSTLWLGYGWIYSDPAGTDAYDEHRIWQQYTWAKDYAANNFFLRSRLEQRFLETGDDVGWRFRQFFKVSYPFSFEPRLTLAAYEEVFVNFNDTDWGAEAGFDQNRLFAGLGWTLDREKHVRVELGYLNQFIHRPTRSDEMNHIFSLNFFLSF